MKTIRNIYILWALLCVGPLAFAQQSTTTLTPGYWTFGINAGLSYQSSDVRSTLDGFGMGLSLGKNYYYRPGAPLAFDLRGRFLYARQYGLGTERFFPLPENRLLNGSLGPDYVNFPGQAQGFTFANHRTTTGELALEGLLTLNRLRERSRVHLAFFGGVGLVGYGASIDQLNAQGQEYYEGYANINPNTSRSAVRRDLRSLLEGNYETPASNPNGANFNIAADLNAGFELGYYLSPRFLLYGGHRVAFTGTDYLDGTPNLATKNDAYHYTNIGLRWIIEPARNKPLALLPEINLISPVGSPFTTNIGNGLVIANIRNINSAADVDCIVNGRSVPFRFDNGRFSVDVPLNPGSNDVLIVARNAQGQAREIVNILYQEEVIANPTPPRLEAPVVRFTNPAGNSARTAEPDFGIRATVDNVQSSRDVTFLVNGAERDFLLENGVLRANIPLREGDNRVQIRARNTVGSDAAEVIISREAIEAAPVVNITEPAGSRVESRFSPARVSAQIRNVSSRSDISVTHNGRLVQNFDFNASQNTLAVTISLENGANTVVVNARNRAGDARDEVTILYQDAPPAPRYPPAVRITEPARNTATTTQASVRIEAIIDNVSNRNDITFTVNGSRRTNFNFDSRTGRFDANISLITGNNDVEIRASNPDGQDRQSVSIRRIQEQVNPLRPPAVRITNPRDNSETTEVSVEIRANIDNVNSNRDIAMFVNGRNASNFSFSRGQLTARINLETGNNTVRIRATNLDGSDEQTVNIRYRPQPAPTVRIEAPSNNSETGTASASLRARVDNVERKDQITVLLNGRSIGSSFNFDSNRREVTATLSLTEGNNTIRVEARTNGGANNDEVNVRYRRAAPPTVSITAPANNSTVSAAAATLRARVTNVSNRNDLTVRVNGNLINNFSFSGSDLSASIVLREGNNTLTVRAATADGSDEATVNVRLQTPQPPTVRISEPGDNSTTNQEKATVRARITNVGNARSVTFTVNSQPVSNFTLTGEDFSATIDLQASENTIRISARNDDGQDEAAVKVTYNRRTAQVAQPTVRFTQPSKPGIVVKDRAYTVRAGLTNVASASEIKMWLNEEAFTDFVYNSRSRQVSADLKLKAGQNVVRIQVENRGGSDSAETEVIYDLGDLPLIVIESISQPASNPFRPQVANSTLIAKIERIESRENVKIFVNSAQINDFSFDNASKKLQATLPLTKGTNTVVIRATNERGESVETRNVEF